MSGQALSLPGHRHVFIGGLHRSGTTLLEQILSEHPDVSGLRETGVPHDEGQHLHHVLTTAMDLGGPGRFAFHQDAHLTELSPSAAAETRDELLAAWSPFWDLSRPVLVEKSPPNLLRFRLLQSVFPEAAFVAIVRHPVAVAYATEGWSRTRIDELLHHWLVAHERFEEDRGHVRRLMLVRYEDLAADPEGVVGRVDEFLGLAPHAPEQQVRRDTNDRYLGRWHHSRAVPSVLRNLPARLRFERRLRALGYGYSLAGPKPE